MKIDLIWSLPHYRTHLQPIYDRLPEHLRGQIHAHDNYQIWDKASTIALVAGWQDVAVLGSAGVRTIFVEHGAGQTYVENHPSYSGSGGHKHVGTIGFIAPSSAVASRWLTAPAVGVGCPKLDKYRGLAPTEPNSICFTWHWDGTLNSETRSTWTHHSARLADTVKRLKQMGHTVYGHSHPRWDGALDEPMRSRGLNVLRGEDAVFRTCGMLVADNTSLSAEFSSLGRPVALLNSPTYRRDINHGGRFWEWTKVTPTFETLDDLVEGDWMHPCALGELVYDYNDGWASTRAVDHIIDLVLDLS